MSYEIIFPFSSSLTPGISEAALVRGPTPDKNKRFPTRRACGYKPTGSGALEELKRFSLISTVVFGQSLAVINRLSAFDEQIQIIIARFFRRGIFVFLFGDEF